MNRLKILGLSALLLLAACAQQPYRDESLPLDERLALLGFRQGEATDSILAFNVSGWQHLDSRHITLESGIGRNFLIVFSNPCYNLESGNRIGYSTTGGSLTRLDRIVAVDNGMPQSCLIGDIYRLEKLPKAERKES
ncbi:MULTISPECIES: DUF6491 family protein [Pseudomonas]|uniref:Lipoprotein n=1 Tax=Pseudomonas kuykendallii TaxID=1007099 RepID=A0A1H2XM59_9PSED|nr:MULTISPECIES: DUF6491 family protein [Pseudomonas]MCQ4272654.1 DUF6491 family protein [Pseudomonas kuykendallii]SDW93972.1 hypothetical protein SAMN05216287_1960 [Pseudomonas kuykendallii]